MRTIITANLFGKKLSIPFSEITHFTSGDKYVSAHYPGGELILDETLIGIEAEFGQYLTRTHRRTLVKTHLIEHVIKHPVSKFAEARITGVPDLIRVSATYYQPVCDLMKARRMAA